VQKHKTVVSTGATGVTPTSYHLTSNGVEAAMTATATINLGGKSKLECT
jgi:hypothetical protein